MFLPTCGAFQQFQKLPPCPVPDFVALNVNMHLYKMLSLPLWSQLGLSIETPWKGANSQTGVLWNSVKKGQDIAACVGLSCCSENALLCRDIEMVLSLDELSREKQHWMPHAFIIVKNYYCYWTCCAWHICFFASIVSECIIYSAPFKPNHLLQCQNALCQSRAIRKVQPNMFRMPNFNRPHAWRLFRIIENPTTGQGDESCWNSIMSGPHEIFHRRVESNTLHILCRVRSVFCTIFYSLVAYW